MKKSLLRSIDVFELFIMQLACFVGNSLFDYADSLGKDSYIWWLFYNIKDYRGLIVAASTIIVIVCYYQILCRKKVEIYCRILVGDTLSGLSTRYSLICLGILGVSYCAAILIDSYFGYSLLKNFYLFCLFVIYAVLSAILLKEYKNF